MKTKRSSLNFIIDYLMAVTFCAMGGIGIMLLTALPPTRQLREAGIADNRALLGGLDRHQWGFVHLIIALLFIILLLLHIYFHRAQISCLYKRWTKGNPIKRFILGPLFVAVCILMLGLPCFMSPTTQTTTTPSHMSFINANQQATSRLERLQTDTSNNQRATSYDDYSPIEYRRLHKHNNKKKLEKRGRRNRRNQ